MPMEICNLEDADIAEVGQRCKVVSLGRYDEKCEVGDVLEIIAKSPNHDYLMFKKIGDEDDDWFYLHRGTVIERIKD